MVSTTYGIIGTKWTKHTPKKLPEKPIEIKLIFKPKTKAIGGRIVGRDHDKYY